MIKEIKYNGYSANPSDYECADGDLATTMGLIQEDGAMKPVLPPSTILTLAEGKKVVFIHETSAFKHYIISDDMKTSADMTSSATLSWMNEGDSELTTLSWVPGYVGVQAIGNTLMIICEERVLYFLWKEGAYDYLGDHIPDVDISFGLVGHPRLFSVSDESHSTFDTGFTLVNGDLRILSDDEAIRITETVFAKVNKFIKEQTVDKGRFCFPFFVRYALRLYDGSLVGHSAPILMNPSTISCPLVFSAGGTKADIMLVAASLDYCIHNTRTGSLSNWTDIVKSIDIFISKPIYTYDQNGKIRQLIRSIDFWADRRDSLNATYFIGRLFVKNTTTADNTIEDCIKLPFANDDIIGDLSDMYAEWDYSQIYSMYFASSNRNYPRHVLSLPKIDTKKIDATIADTSTFFKLHSIDFKGAVETGDSNNEQRKEIEIEDDYLGSLLTREVMTDDYLSHDHFIPTWTMVYNQRLNLCGVKKKMFEGFPIRSMLAFHNYFYNWTSTDGETIKIEKLTEQKASFSVKVLIKENGENYGVEYSAKVLPQILSPLESKYGLQQRWIPDSSGGLTTFKESIAWGSYFFYPNANAYKMIIYDERLKITHEVALQPHNFLNGAFAFLGFLNTHNSSTEDVDTSLIPFGKTISIPNKIFTSEVNNPFYFPVLGINTIGTGDILGISTAAKALSEGQFGQFPLYAFTTDGVWALEVSATGTYSAKQPITRDVVINPDSITQIDSAVLFATDRGIMHISGSTVQCISDRLNTEELFSIADLPKCDKLINIFNGKADESEQVTLADITLLPFNEFLQGCRMVYDYTNQHLIVYNPAVRYAYVYSLKSQTWGMTHSDIESGVNSYPEALAMTHAGELVDFSKPVAENITALIITRPFKIDDPNMFKTINTIIQRGMFRSTHVQQVLYGSNDLIHWHTIWSSVDKIMRGFRGTPYKAFRLALVCKFDRGESIYGCTVVYEPRMTNQVR